MAASLETRTIPVTVTYLVENTIRTTRVDNVVKTRWFMNEANAAVNQNILVIQSKDPSNGRIIR
jgi:hypothetical protein